MHDIIDPEEAYLSAWRAGYREGFMKTGYLMDKSIMELKKPIVTPFIVVAMVSFIAGMFFFWVVA